ncbi:DUF5305 domain-containing protein [Halorubrum vacuolatum]|uniref:DUF5305 domain-containing protein n=1 Tax=Halorubrum vacuolatum TaxID=63740 RepID=UPI00117B58A6|nr:DUF5305 domain-containing protein [Halorubrum vacuolatum]
MSSWLIAVVIVLLLLSGAAVAATYHTHTNPPIERDEVVIAAWSEETRLSHQARVTEPNLVFEQGQTLPNRAVYFSRVSPILEAQHDYSYVASDEGNLTVETDVTVRLRSVDSGGNVYWQRSDIVDHSRVEGLAPGETATTRTDLNVSEVVEELDRTEESLGATLGTTEIRVLFDTSVVGTVNGEPVRTNHVESILVEPSSGSFTVQADGGVRELHERTEIIESEGVHGPVRTYGPVGLLFVSMAGMVSLFGLDRTGRLTPTADELDMLDGSERDGVEDWISTVSIPAEALATTPIPVESLKDLVDIAIDTNQRVLEDEDREGFYVLDETVHYVYSPEKMKDPIDFDHASEEMETPVDFDESAEPVDEGTDASE